MTIKIRNQSGSLIHKKSSNKSYKFSWALLLHVIITVIITSCKSTGGNSVENPEITSVSYLNSIFGVDRLESFIDTTYAFSLSINFDGTLDKNQIQRISLTPENNVLDLGWEVIDRAQMISTGNSLILENLIYPDLDFTYFADINIVIEWQDGDQEEYQFEYEGNFNNLTLDLQEWYDQETVRLTLKGKSEKIDSIDSLKIYWLNNDLVISTTSFGSNDIKNNVILTDEIPVTSTSYFIKSNHITNDIRIETQSSNYTLPDRLPPNLTFINEKNQNSEYSDIYIANSQNDKFILITMRSSGELLVIDPVQKRIDFKFELSGFVESTTLNDSAIYIGFNNGDIIAFDLYSGSQKILSTIDGYPQGMMATDRWLFVSDGGLYTIDLLTGEIVSSRAFYGLSTQYFVYSSSRKMGFTSRETTLFGFNINESDGKVSNVWETRPSGKWLFSLYLNPDQSEIVALNGSVLRTGNESIEIELVGMYEHYISSPVFDIENDRLYSVRRINYPTDTRDLDIYRMSDKTHLRKQLVEGDAYLITEKNNTLYLLSIAGVEGNRLAILEYEIDELEVNSKLITEKSYILPHNYTY